MGRRPRFSRDEIGRAAVDVLDRDGTTGLTMRAVADVLGTGPMTLYTYVDDRAALDSLVVDTVLAEVSLVETPGGDWRSDLGAVAESVWRAVRSHPHAVPLILARRSRSPAFLDIAEAILEPLARAGLRGPDLLAGFRAVTTFATAFGLTELTGPLATERDDATETVEEFRALATERYPRLVEIAGSAATSNPEDEFRTGLAALLDGLAPG